MQDGSRLPEPVEVEAFCGSSVGLTVSRTNSQGGFVLWSGYSGATDARPQPRGVRSGNASGFGGALGGTAHLAGCELRAKLPGYRSGSIKVWGNDDFYLGTIVLSRRAGVEGSTFSGTALNAPRDARKNFDKAKQALEKKKLDQAKPLLAKVVAEYPQHAAAWYELGRIHEVAKDLPRARHAFEQAMKADPKYTPPYLSMAAVYNSERYLFTALNRNKIGPSNKGLDKSPRFV